MGIWTRLMGRWKRLDGEREEVLFSGARRNPRDMLLSFWVNESLYEELRTFSGGRDISRLVRASIKLGLGIFRECPELMKAVDLRGKQKHHVTVWVDEATAGRVVVVSGNQQSRFIRASVEVGLPFFSAHPGIISTLESECEE